MTATRNRTRDTRDDAPPSTFRDHQNPVLSANVAFVHGATPSPGSHGCPGADRLLNCPFRVTASAKLLWVATEDDDEDIPGIERLLALTDGVVAIALTLLVLQLQVPVTDALKEHPESASVLWNALNVDAAELSSYLVSFLVIAQFWMVHHRVLRGMKGHSEGLAWRNFGFLLALTLMPFTSDLIGRYGSNPIAITLFGLNLVAISLSTQWIYLYAAHHNLVVDAVRSAEDERTARVRVVLVLSIVSLSIVLAWTAPNLAKFTWLLFLVVPPMCGATVPGSQRFTMGTQRATTPRARAGRVRGSPQLMTDRRGARCLSALCGGPRRPSPLPSRR